MLANSLGIGQNLGFIIVILMGLLRKDGYKIYIVEFHMPITCGPPYAHHVDPISSHWNLWLLPTYGHLLFPETSCRYACYNGVKSFDTMYRKPKSQRKPAACLVSLF